MELNKRYDSHSGEVLYYSKHPSGLNVYIMPRKDYSSSYAIFGTKYGSVDSEFVVPGENEATKVPDGIAHYLEHKMFDMPDGSNAFDKFSAYGGNANAYTSFNMTAYLFSATANLKENLENLLNYVQTPYFTKESVEKEQGIIGQEIKMYDDNAPWCVFFNMLSCLYKNNPVRLNIAGTVESISEITDELLYKCYRTFYNLSNMTLFVTGDFDAAEVAEIIDANILNNDPFDSEIERIYPEEPKEIAAPYAEAKLSIAKPIFMIGWKDNDIGYGGEKLLKKLIEMDILTEMIFGKSTPLYTKLYSEGLINGSFSADYTAQLDYAYFAVDGESPDPGRVYDEIISYIKGLEISEVDFERIKKVVWGDYIRLYNDIEEYANVFLAMSFLGINYMDYYEAYSNITFEDIKKRLIENFDSEKSVLSVVLPK